MNQNGNTYRPPHLSKDQDIEIGVGDVVRVSTPGGGGFGDPARRDPAAIRRDVARGDYTEAEVHDSLVMIGAQVESSGGGRWTVTPPTWRPDLTDALTLVEEVARIVGYDRIPSALPIAPAGRGLTRAQRARRRVAQTLAAAGATEVLAYPFVSDATVELFEPGASAVRLANALDPQLSLLRRTLLPGLLETARRNLSRGLTDLALFEVGTVFRPESGVTYGTDFIPVGAERPEQLGRLVRPGQYHPIDGVMRDERTAQPLLVDLQQANPLAP